MKSQNKYKVLVMGVSFGGMNALPKVLGPLPDYLPVPVIVVQHLHPTKHCGFLIEYLDRECWLKVKEAREREPIIAGTVYIAPADRHMFIEDNKTLALSNGRKVNYSRPSIDVLFASAVRTYGSEVIGVLLTGANRDGASGMRLIKDGGGLTIVQDPETAEAPNMPQAAIKACNVDYILPLKEIPRLLVRLLMEQY